MGLPRIARGDTAHVDWDRSRRVPKRIVARGTTLRVTGLAGRREELAAFPADRGPRITYLLETDHGPATLVFDASRRAWYVEPLDRAA